MAIEFYAAMAEGGKIVSLDDQSVVKDLAAAAGTGGNAYIGYLVNVLMDPGNVGGYGRFRRLVQRIPHSGAVTVSITPWRDGSDTGQTITRALTASDNPTVVAPSSVTGSVFQSKISLSSFDAPAAIGAGELTVVPKRSTR